MFDRSIKTHERIRRTGMTIQPTLNFTQDMKLPTRESIMKSAHNKGQLIKIFCNENSAENVFMVGEENCIFKHEEADCNVISYVKLFIE